MKVQGQQDFEANREVIWSLLHDPLILQRIIPGCDSLDAVSPDEYNATVAIRIGTTIERLTGALRFERVVPHQSYHFVAEGSNPDGTVSCRGRIVLEERGPETTSMAYEADFEVTGRPAAVTQRMLQTTARAFARRSLEALQREVTIRTRTYTTTASPASVPGRVNVAIDAHRSPVRGRLMLVLAILLALLFLRRGLDRRQSRPAIRGAAGLSDESRDGQPALARDISGAAARSDI